MSSPILEVENNGGSAVVRVLVGVDGGETLEIKITDEGIIVDVMNDDGDVRSTMAHTFLELVDQADSFGRTDQPQPITTRPKN